MTTGNAAGDEHGGSWMTARFEMLVDQLHRGKIDRRAFIVRAVALGVSSSAVMSALSRGRVAAAQEASAASIGNPDIPHIEGTDKGLIKVYSSWPRTGSMEGIGVDALEAAKLAFADFGNMAGGFAIEYVPLDSGIAANNGGGGPGGEAANPEQGIFPAGCMGFMGTHNTGAAQI